MFNTDVQNLIVSGGISSVDCQSYTLHVGFFNIKLNKQKPKFSNSNQYKPKPKQELRNT